MGIYSFLEEMSFINTYTSYISLNISGRQAFDYITAKQGDSESRYIVITLLENGEQIIPGDGVSAVFRGKKPDGRTFLNDAVINEDGTITVELTSQILSVDGIVKAEIVLYDENDAVLSTASFRIKVIRQSLNTKSITSSNEFSTLINLINQARTATDSATIATESAESAAQSVSEVITEAQKATDSANEIAQTALEMIETYYSQTETMISEYTINAFAEFINTIEEADVLDSDEIVYGEISELIEMIEQEGVLDE